MRIHFQSVAFFLSLATYVTAIPAWGSLAGLSEDEIEIFMRSVTVTGAQPPPPPNSNTSSFLVNDADHPYQEPGPNDIRGPCPGLNTLASHGYLDRSGIATPQEIVNAVQQGFNMGNDLAVLVTWGAFVVDGNPLTNLMSIGKKSSSTGNDPPKPAIVGGLNTHKVFEGDASTTRGDFYFGDNFSFNETLFQVFTAASNTYGGGKYNASAAMEVRWNRIQDSLARNPTFDFTTPRYFTAYAESAFPYRFFVDGRDTSAALDLTVARSFFQNGRYPQDFHRREGAYGTDAVGDDIGILFNAHPIAPGHNEGAGNYVLDPEDPGFAGLCYLYTKHVNVTVRSLYPNPTGKLRKALKENLSTFYFAAIGNSSTCPEILLYD